MTRYIAKTVVALTLALLTLAPSAEAFVRVYVGSPPPPPIVEVRPSRPRSGLVWQPGYYRWTGSRYRWRRGRWVRPPRRNAVWVGARWERGRRGWYEVPGYWR